MSETLKERRIINGKEYWVIVNITADGSRIETVVGDPLGDAARIQAEHMAKVFEQERLINEQKQKELEWQLMLERDKMNNRQVELENEIALERRLADQKIKAEQERAIREANYDPDKDHIVYSEYYQTMNEYEKEAYFYYITNIKKKITLNEFKKFIESKEWEDAWVKIQEEERAQKLEWEKEGEMLQAQHEKEKKEFWENWNKEHPAGLTPRQKKIRILCAIGFGVLLTASIFLGLFLGYKYYG